MRAIDDEETAVVADLKVPSHILRNLLLPELRSFTFRYRPAIVPMPKTSVNEDDEMKQRNDEIRRAGQIGTMEVVFQTPFVGQTLNGEFRSGVFLCPEPAGSYGMPGADPVPAFPAGLATGHAALP